MWFEIGIPIKGIFLAFSPGGLPEMSLVALALNIKVSFVALCHISRIAMFVLGANALSRFNQ
ncbi:AbrB family transcriptional regulator [Thalassospira sp. MIT1370]|uniref:AbrB family transcriptional regulator n=1 Tax=unclassified Thalassospira TaxID=2648997 RepID=UPI00399A6349